MTPVAARPIRRAPLPVGTFLLVLIVLIGAVAAFIRFSQGLGASTNLRDDVPWGLWIGLDVMSGVALSAGGFTMAAVVYVFRLKQYYPLVRPALLTAFIGYLLAAGAILFDLGRPDRFYHPFIFWNHHSVMFEIAWSVISYLTILGIENSQLALERLRLKALLGLVRRLIIVFVILGIIISTLHQSSLGGLYLLVPQKMHPLWYTPIIPILFYISAIAVGFSMVIVEATLTAAAFHRKQETHLLSGIGGWLPWILVVYLAVLLGNLLFSGKIGLLFMPGLAALFFWVELIVGVLAPLAILAQPKLRRDHGWLFVGALLVTAGVVINRFNVIFWGQGGVVYAPTWIEFAVSAGLISLGVLLFMVGVKYFPVLDQHGH